MTIKGIILRILISIIFNFAFIIFAVKIKQYNFTSYILGLLQMGLYLNVCAHLGGD